MIQRPEFESHSGDSQNPNFVPQAGSQDQLESQIESIRQQSNSFEQRFNQLDQRLSQLTDQISNLVSGGPSPNSPANTDFQAASGSSDETDATPVPDWNSSNESGALGEQTTSAPNTQPSQKNESVAELLERMKAEGQWDGVEDVQEPLAPTETESAPAPVSTPVSPETTTASGVDDVGDYMDQLLARMRGEASPTTVTAPTNEASSIAPATDGPSTEAIAQPTVEHPELMSEADFKPLNKAKKIKSLDAMRELANSTARTAVASSEESRLKTQAFMQLAIAVASLVMSGYYFGVASKFIGDTAFFVGITCVCLSGLLIYRFMGTLNQKAVSSPTP